MKKLLFVVFAFASVHAFAQSSKVFCLQGSCKQTINAGDSATLFVQMTTSDMATGTFGWKQTSGPGIAFSPVSGGVSGVSQSYAGVRPLSNGTYIFTVVGTSFGGISSSVQDTLVVNAVARRVAYITITSVTKYTDSTTATNTAIIK
jgi:hypothetical protein